MKKLCLILAFLILFPLLFTACDSNDTKDDLTTEAHTTQEATSISTLKTEEPTQTETTAPNTTPEPPTPTVPKSLKILAIGNSFSTDAMEYLYSIAKSAGVKTVVLGNMYIGSCSLDMHLQHATDNDGAYTYYKNTTGTWTQTKKATFSSAIKDEDWDFITFQQTSKTSGLAPTYTALDDLIAAVKSKATNPDVKLLWHMTWAYQQDSTIAAFSNYNKNQMTMYTMITNTVKGYVMKRDSIDGVIPSGTAIQNARTSFVGDTLTRDGYHLDYTLGRYIAGLTYFAAITGLDISNIPYAPASDITPAVKAMAKDAVMDAIATPYEVTQSTHTEGTWKNN